MFKNYKGTKNANLRLFDTFLLSLNIFISFSNRLNSYQDSDSLYHRLPAD